MSSNNSSSPSPQSPSSPSPKKSTPSTASTDSKKPIKQEDISSPAAPFLAALNSLLPPGWDKIFFTGAIRWLRRAVIASSAALAANIIISGVVEALLEENKPVSAHGLDMLGAFLRMLLDGRLQKPVAAVRRSAAQLFALLLFREHFALGATLSAAHSLVQRSSSTPMLKQHALNAFLVLLYAATVRFSS